ncbi:unnamed protein product, partial [Mesorhabditis spiculigera]
MTVVKIKYGSDIRKSAVHNNDLTLNDLLLMAQRIFNISPQEPFTLKYKDSDGDLITLAEDSDLRLALDSNSSDTLSVFVNGDNAAAETLKAQFSQLQSDFERLLNAINSAEVRHNASHPEPTQPLKVNGGHGYGHQHASPEPSPAPEIAPPATIQATYNEKSLNNFQHNHNESLSAIEDEIPLGAEAASVASSHHVSHMNVSSIVSPHGEPPAQYQQQQQTFSPPASVPSYPPQSMGHPPAAYPEPTPPAPQQYNNNPQYGQQAPPPPVPGFPPSGGPPSNTPFAPVPQYGGQPPNTPASNAPPAGNPPFSGPPTNFGQAPQQQVPPPPGPPQQFGQPGQPLGGYPGAQPGYQPMGFPSSQAPPVPEPSHQYGAPPSFPGGHGAPPPSAFPPGSQGPPMGGPPMMPPSGMPPGANPFARGPAPPTGYRQSPYHQ